MKMPKVSTGLKKAAGNFHCKTSASSYTSRPIKSTGGLHMGKAPGMGMGRHMKGIR